MLVMLIYGEDATNHYSNIPSEIEQNTHLSCPNRTHIESLEREE